MLNKVQDVFDIAIRLMDEQNEQTGATVTADTTEYRVRTVSLINSLLDIVYPASDTYDPSEDGTRPICEKATTMESELDLDEAICTSVLPYGLAYLLLSDENPQLSAYFLKIYEANLVNCLNNKPSSFEDIDNPYGNIEYGGYARW